MFGMQNMTAVWVVLMIVFLIVEGVIPGLVSIWFALGSLAALIAAMLGAQIWLQGLWFVIVSLAALILTRPLARKYVNSRTQATNADIGTGAVFIAGKDWTARCSDPEQIIEAGTVAVVEKIEGVKLIVKKK